MYDYESRNSTYWYFDTYRTKVILFYTNLTISPAIRTIHHSLADIFDKQCFKGMGFKNEKYLEEKKSKKYKFFGTK